MANPPKADGRPSLLHGIRATYANKIAHLGMLPVFILPSFPKSMIEYMYQEASGLLFMGGSDIHPQHYGEKLEAHTTSHEPERDLLELLLLRQALQDQKPFLGICRGHQMLAVASGGKLYQHLPAVFPEEDHGLGEGAEYEDLLQGRRHRIIIETDTKLFGIVGEESIETNTAHHQGVKELGSDLLVSAYSEKGVIEAIEHIDQNYFCLGLQCHPEVLGDEPLTAVFTHFANAVESYEAEVEALKKTL